MTRFVNLAFEATEGGFDGFPFSNDYLHFGCEGEGYWENMIFGETS